jgi:hypothetical protein
MSNNQDLHKAVTDVQEKILLNKKDTLLKADPTRPCSSNRKKRSFRKKMEMGIAYHPRYFFFK